MEASDNGFFDTIQQGLVFEQHHVSFENFAIPIARERFQAFLKIDQLFLRNTNRLLEAALLISDSFFGNLVDLGSRKSPCDHMDRADGNPRGRRDPRVSNFMLHLRICHPLPAP